MCFRSSDKIILPIQLQRKKKSIFYKNKKSTHSTRIMVKTTVQRKKNTSQTARAVQFNSNYCVSQIAHLSAFIQSLF
jgi:hypothetical protein